MTCTLCFSVSVKLLPQKRYDDVLSHIASQSSRQTSWWSDDRLMASTDSEEDNASHATGETQPGVMLTG